MRKIISILCAILLLISLVTNGVVLSDEPELEIGIAFGNEYYLYVTDPINDRVIMFDREMSYQGVFFDKCDECPDWELGNPVGIATDRYLNCVIISDIESKHAYHVNFNGVPYWNQYDPEDNEVLETRDIAACEINDDIGNYGIDRAGNKLMRYDPPFIDFDKSKYGCEIYCYLRFTVPNNYQNQPAPAGRGEGEFNNPEGVMVDRRGYVLVADTGNNRIQKFRRNGEFILEFGGDDDEFQLSRPVDLVPDWDEKSPNRYYIVDQGNNRIVITDEYGKYIDEIKPMGDDGKSLFYRINSIAVDNRGDVWITDSGGQTIYKFGSLDSDKPLSLLGSINDVLVMPSMKTRRAVLKIKWPSAHINSVKVPIEPRAQIVDGRTMIPVRWLMDNVFTQIEDDDSPNYKSSVEWNDSQKKATLTIPEIDFGNRLFFESRKIELWLNNSKAMVNGKSVPIDVNNPDVTTKTIDDRLFVPLRFVSEAFGAGVSWIPKDGVPRSKDGIVRISFPNYDELSLGIE